MVLDDVAEDPRLLVELPAPLDAERLGDGDLDVVDVAPVPERLEDAVAEAEHQDVLRRLLAEVVVDPEDLALAEGGADGLVQRAGRGEVVAERLLDDEPRPGARRVDGVDEPRLAEARGGGADARGRDREVVEPVPREAALGLEGLEARLQVDEALRLAEVAPEVEEARGEGVPVVVVVGRPAELGEGGLQVAAPGVVGVDRAGEADDRRLRGELPLAVELEEGRDELAAREVARAPEDDDGRRGRRGGAHALGRTGRRTTSGS